VMGKALQSIPREKYYISTKAGRYGDEDFNFSAEHITKEFENSLKRLGLDYVDILFLHDIEFGDMNQILKESIPAIQKLKEQGKCKFIGVTGYPLKIFEDVLQNMDIDVILTYCHYSLNDNSLERILPLLKEKNVGILNGAALSMGLLTTPGPREWHPCSQNLKNVAKKAADFCVSQGTDIAKLAIQYSIKNVDLASTLVGISSVPELEKNVNWALEPMNEEIYQKVQDILAPIHNEVWSSGKPENN